MQDHLSWWPFSAYSSYKPVSLNDTELFDELDDELAVEVADQQHLLLRNCALDKSYIGDGKMGKQSVNIASTLEFQSYEVSVFITYINYSINLHFRKLAIFIFYR